MTKNDSTINLILVSQIIEEVEDYHNVATLLRTWDVEHLRKPNNIAFHEFDHILFYISYL